MIRHVLTWQTGMPSCVFQFARALRADCNFLAAGRRCRGPSQAELVEYEKQKKFGTKFDPGFDGSWELLELIETVRIRCGFCGRDGERSLGFRSDCSSCGHGFFVGSNEARRQVLRRWRVVWVDFIGRSGSLQRRVVSVCSASRSCY